jgi:hypothetical protein
VSREIRVSRIEGRGERKKSVEYGLWQLPFLFTAAIHKVTLGVSGELIKNPEAQIGVAMAIQ